MEVNNLTKQEMLNLGKLTETTVKVLDKPGELSKVLDILLSVNSNIVEIVHDRTNMDDGTCVVYVLSETRDLNHRNELYKKLKDSNYSHYKNN